MKITLEFKAERILAKYQDQDFSYSDAVSFAVMREMNFPAASRGVSMYDKFYPNAASCGELNPADFTISTTHVL